MLKVPHGFEVVAESLPNLVAGSCVLKYDLTQLLFHVLQLCLKSKNVQKRDRSEPPEDGSLWTSAHEVSEAWVAMPVRVGCCLRGCICRFNTRICGLHYGGYWMFGWRCFAKSQSAHGCPLCCLDHSLVLAARLSPCMAWNSLVAGAFTEASSNMFTRRERPTGNPQSFLPCPVPYAKLSPGTAGWLWLTVSRLFIDPTSSTYHRT